jgi:hypothetical protein
MVAAEAARPDDDGDGMLSLKNNLFLEKVATRSVSRQEIRRGFFGLR